LSCEVQYATDAASVVAASIESGPKRPSFAGVQDAVVNFDIRTFSGNRERASGYGEVLPFGAPKQVDRGQRPAPDFA
jgi:hypothetical protein